MGYNTTVVIVNDALEAIAEDPNFGKELKTAILKAVSKSQCPVHVSAGCYSIAASVIETHHADFDVLVRVGDNRGVVVEIKSPEQLGNPDEFVGVMEIAEAMSVSSQTVRNWIFSGRLPAEKISDRWVIRMVDFEKMVDR